VEPDALVDIDNSSGPVFLYVRTDFTFRGQQLLAENVANVLLGAAGTTRSGLERSWKGIVVVPNGHLEMPTLAQSDYYGSYFAKQLTLHQYTDLYHEPFLPENFCQSDSP